MLVLLAEQHSRHRGAEKREADEGQKAQTRAWHGLSSVTLALHKASGRRSRTVGRIGNPSVPAEHGRIANPSYGKSSPAARLKAYLFLIAPVNRQCEPLRPLDRLF